VPGGGPKECRDDDPEERPEPHTDQEDAHRG
jgi:hypothetical protein